MGASNIRMAHTSLRQFSFSVLWTKLDNYLDSFLYEYSREKLPTALLDIGFHEG